MQKTPILVVILGLIFLLIVTCTHTVKEYEQALILEFGQAKRVENPDCGRICTLSCFGRR